MYMISETNYKYTHVFVRLFTPGERRSLKTILYTTLQLFPTTLIIDDVHSFLFKGVFLVRRLHLDTVAVPLAPNVLTHISPSAQENINTRIGRVRDDREA